MIAQPPRQTDNERPVSTHFDRNMSVAVLPKQKGGVSEESTNKTPKPRFETVHLSWEYFQNELEFE